MARLDREQVQIVAPTLLWYEIVAVARKWTHRKLATSDEAQRALDTLLRCPVVSVMDNGLLRRAYEIATLLELPTAYDAQYLAVAERYECEFWMADERLHNAVSSRFPSVQWLGSQEVDGDDPSST